MFIQLRLWAGAIPSLETNKVPSNTNLRSFGVHEWKHKMFFICHGMDERDLPAFSFKCFSICCLFTPDQPVKCMLYFTMMPI